MPREKSPSAQESEANDFDEEYEVDQILDKRLTNKGMIYLIKWKGYPDPADYTWEPLQHLTQVQHMIAQFNEKLRNKTQQKVKPIQKPAKSSIKQKNVQNPKRTSSKKRQNTEKAEKSHRVEKQQQDEQQIKLKRGKAQKSKPRAKSISPQQSNISNSEEKEIYTKRSKGQVKNVFRSRKQSNLKGNEEKDDQALQWDKKYHLGRIVNHYVKYDTLYFTVHLNDKEDKVVSSVSLTQPQLKKLKFKQLYHYCEQWCRDRLIDQMNAKDTQNDQFQRFWKDIK